MNKLWYQFGESVAAGNTDPLSGGGAVQPEGAADACLCPGGTDAVFDGIENRCRQKEGRLADSLQRKHSNTLNKHAD